MVSPASGLLSGRVDPGVWFPEEAVDAGDDAAAVLNLASVGAHTVEVSGELGIAKYDVWGK